MLTRATWQRQLNVAFLTGSAGARSTHGGSEAAFLGDTASIMDGTDDMDADDDDEEAVDPRELKRQRREQEQGDAEFPDEVSLGVLCPVCAWEGHLLTHHHATCFIRTGCTSFPQHSSSTRYSSNIGQSQLQCGAQRFHLSPPPLE